MRGNGSSSFIIFDHSEIGLEHIHFRDERGNVSSTEPVDIRIFPLSTFLPSHTDEIVLVHHAA